MTDLASTTALRERLDAHAEFLRKERQSVPPPLDLRASEPEPELTPERAAEIGKLIREKTFLRAFGVTPLELLAYTKAAKRGVGLP